MHLHVIVHRVRGRLFFVSAISLGLLRSAPVQALDVLMPARIGIVQDARLLKIVAEPATTFPIPAVGGPSDPTANATLLTVTDTGGTGILLDDLTAGTWTGLGSPPGAKGFRYTNPAAPAGGPVKRVVLRGTVLQILARDDGTLNGPLAGSLGVTLMTGTDTYCALLGGTTIRNQAGLLMRRNAPAPSACPSPCCNGARFHSFTVADAPGDCGDIISFLGSSRDLFCGGLYMGAGGNSVPLPTPVPDLGQGIAAIAACNGQTATLTRATAAQTGSNRNCTAARCLFGPPLAIRNSASTPTSTCVINAFATALSGTLDCSSGATHQTITLSSEVFLTGDTATDPGSTIAGIQPCPLCDAGTCVGGPNNGMACSAATSELGDAYPTSHDCPPDAMLSIGTRPIGLAVSTGTVSWTAFPTGDDSSQSRVFSGFCRDADDTLEFQRPAVACFENGMTVTTCSDPADSTPGTYEACEQRNNGAFGPGGGSTMTITAIGSPEAGLLSAPAAGTLVSVFSVPPSFSAMVDAASDLPGPGAVSLPGTGALCADALACP